MVVYVLIGEYNCESGVCGSIITIKPNIEECRYVAENVDMVNDGWYRLLIQEWTEYGLRDEIEV